MIQNSFIRSSITLLSLGMFCVTPVLAQGPVSPESEGAPAMEAPEAPINEITLPEPAPPFDTDTASPLGQDHYYTVTLRGNGEAVVSMKAIFSNLTDIPLVSLNLESPVADLENLAVYQVKHERECFLYAPRPMISERVDELRETQIEQKCLQYREPDYYSYWYGQSQYLKAQTRVQGQQIEVTLTEPVEPGKSGSVLLTYRTTAYTDKTAFGAYEYIFETLQVDDHIYQLQVGITTDNDLYLKDAETQVNYQEAMPKMAALSDHRVAIESSQFDSFYQQIGFGQIVKTASSLQPLESYTIEGVYADSQLQLYGKELIIGVIVCIVLVALLIIAVVVTIKKLRNGATVSSSKATHTGNSLLNGRNILVAVGGSFASALSISLFTGVFIAGIMYLSRIVGYQYSVVITVFFLLISIGIYLCLLLIPAILIGVKRGLFVAVATVCITILWLIVIFIIILSVIVLFFNTGRGINPIHYRGEALPMMQQSQVEDVSLQ